MNTHTHTPGTYVSALKLPRSRYLRQAETLAAAVHNTLGFTRNGASRLGNATDDHPTRGGLRIGKPNESGGVLDATRPLSSWVAP
jgi:hypothetical protein